MLGTLNGALEVRQVFLEANDLRAEVEGINEIVDGIPVLREVKVHYHIRVPPPRESGWIARWRAIWRSARPPSVCAAP